MSQIKSTSGLNRLAISLACAAVVAAGGFAAVPAHAQSSGDSQVSSLEAEVAYDDQTLQSFAAAAASVLALRGQYYPRIRAAEIAGSKDRADLLFKEMREQMHAAIRNSGFSSEQYRAISRAAKTDDILRGRINSILKGAPPAQQRIQNVRRIAPTAPNNAVPAPAGAAPVTPPAPAKTPTPAKAEAARQPADDGDRGRLEAELSKANTERDRFRAEQLALQKKTEDLERQLAAAKAQDSALREQLTTEKAQAVTAQKKNRKQLEALSGEVTNLKNELSTAQSRDSSLRDELAAERARADAEQSSKEEKIAAFRQEIKGFVERLAAARQELDSLAVDLEPGDIGPDGKQIATFKPLTPLRKEPNSIERLLKKAGPQSLTRLELETKVAKLQKERLEQKVERTVLQREIADLSSALAATYQAMAELIGEPANVNFAATELDFEDDTYTLDLSQETAQLFATAPEQFAQAPADPQADILVDEPLSLGGGDPIDEPGASKPAPSAALEPGLAASLRINPAPKAQIATAPAAGAGTPAAVQTPRGDGTLRDGTDAYKAADFRRAYEIWAQLAESGSAAAQFHLGALYFEGRGTDVDFGQSYFWLRVAAYQGDQRASRLLKTVAGELTSDEIGTSDDQAREWLQKRSIEITQFEPDSNNRL
jgi:predicted  nucleic acid-binding Zn-ribbon protein